MRAPIRQYWNTNHIEQLAEPHFELDFERLLLIAIGDRPNQLVIAREQILEQAIRLRVASKWYFMTSSCNLRKRLSLTSDYMKIRDDENLRQHRRHYCCRP